ncbi:MAG: hypothetical protein KGI06_01845 [Candidatus Micrarchaeota archaeon]|nr:hypothetical protein [Candidatus Micrarchaeota archaeon]
MPIDRYDRGTKEIAKRRVFVFILLIGLIAIGPAFMAEGDMLSHAVDDIAIMGLSLVGLAFLALSWKKNTVSQLRMQNSIILAIFVLLLVIQIFAIVIELHDAADFGDEIPSLVVLALAVINWFV